MALSLSILLLSASILSFEIIVIRILAISHWQPFVTLAISTALLGFGLSGSILSSIRDRAFTGIHYFFPGLAMAAALLYRPVIHVSSLLHLDPGLIIRDPFQWLKVGLLIVVLTIPFTLASGALALPLFERESVGRYYGWNFVGAALGILAVLAALRILDPLDLPRIPALFAGLAFAASLVHFKRAISIWSAAAAVVVSAVILYPSPLVVYGPYKDISYSLKLPSAVVKANEPGITGRFQVVSAPAIRSAAGLSTRYRGALPEQAAVYLNGDRLGTAILAEDPRDPKLEYLRWQTGAAPYVLHGKGSRTAIAGFGGGEEAARAIHLGSGNPVVIEPDKAIRALIKEHPDLFRSWIFGPGAAVIVNDSVRSHFKAHPDPYDIIVYPAGANLAAAAAGLTSTAESYEITVEGIRAVLENLGGSGVLAVSGWNRSPPTGRWKLLSLLGRIEGLNKAGSFGGRVYLINGWSTHTFLVKNRPFETGELKKLNDLASEAGFILTDGDRFPGPEKDRAAAVEDIGYDDLDLRAPTDSRPYPWHSLKLSYLKHLFGKTREAALPRVEWGFFFLIMVFVITAVSALCALTLSKPGGGSSAGFPFGLYFACLGAGYMTIEILLIKRSGLVSVHPETLTY